MTAQSPPAWNNDVSQDEPRAAWQKRIARIRSPEGFYEELGTEHSALFVRRGQTLIVSFETLSDVYSHGENRLPWGLGKDLPADWSVLGVMAHAPTWYRDKAVFDFFDRLTDKGFFEQFDQVVFFGASMGAYAACGFSSAAPGSTVVAIAPQATLDREIAPWESRFRPAWSRDFTSRYGYAPDMITGADQVFLFYDPMSPKDAMHAVMFNGDNLNKFKCRFSGQHILSHWKEMQILNTVITHCIDHDLSPTFFYKLMRKRRDSGRFQKEVLARLKGQERHKLIVQFCSAVLERRLAPAFGKARKASLKALDQNE